MVRGIVWVGQTMRIARHLKNFLINLLIFDGILCLQYNYLCEAFYLKKC